MAPVAIDRGMKLRTYGRYLPADVDTEDGELIDNGWENGRLGLTQVGPWTNHQILHAPHHGPEQCPERYLFVPIAKGCGRDIQLARGGKQPRCETNIAVPSLCTLTSPTW